MRTKLFLLFLFLILPGLVIAQVKPTTKRKIEIYEKAKIKKDYPKVDMREVRPEVEIDAILTRPDQSLDDSTLATRIAENFFLARAYLIVGEFAGRGGWSALNYPPQFVKAQKSIDQARKDWLNLKNERYRQELWKEFKIDLVNLENLAAKIPVRWVTQSAQLGVPMLPWPPPRASATAVVSNHYFDNARNYGQVDEVICRGLDKLGYYDRSYYLVPEGFAIVTRLEQIERDGSSVERPDRWQTNYQRSGTFSLGDYLEALFIAPKGKFRLIVLIVTDQPFAQSSETMTDDQGINLLASGANSLPEEIKEMSFGDGHEVTALIYEFEKRRGDEKGEQVSPSALTGNEHLEASGIRAQIDQQSRSIR